MHQASKIVPWTLKSPERAHVPLFGNAFESSVPSNVRHELEYNIRMSLFELVFFVIKNKTIENKRKKLEHFIERTLILFISEI